MNESAMNKSASSSLEDQLDKATSKVADGAKSHPKKMDTAISKVAVGVKSIQKKSKLPLLAIGVSRTDNSQIKSVEISGRKTTSSVESKKRPSRIPIPVKGATREEGSKCKGTILDAFTHQRPSIKKSGIPVAVDEMVTSNDSRQASTKDDPKSKMPSNAFSKLSKFEEVEGKLHKEAPVTLENTKVTVERDLSLVDVGTTDTGAAGSKDVISIGEIEMYSLDVGNTSKSVKKMERKAYRSKIPIFVALTTAEQSMHMKKNRNEKKTTVPKKDIKSAKKSRIPIASYRQSMYSKFTLKNRARLESDNQVVASDLPKSGLRKRLGRFWKSVKRIFTCKCCRESGEE